MVDIDELTDEEIERVVNTQMFAKALAYRRLADGIDVLSDEGQVYDSLVANVTKQHSQVRSEDSTREFFELFRQEVDAFTAELDADDGGSTTEDIRDVLMTEEGE